jgi:hypothetical protein
MKPKKPKRKVRKAVAYNQTAMAEAIANHFKISCSKQSLQNWQKWDPPFPRPDAGGRYDKQECFDWIEKVYLPKGARGAQQTDLFIQEREAQARTKIRADEQSAYEFDVLKGKYIDRTKAKLTTIGCLKKYHGFVRTELERKSTDARREKLKELGMDPELITKFGDFDLELAKAMIDRIEVECEKAGNVPHGN